MRRKNVILLVTLICSLFLVTGVVSASTVSKDGGTGTGHGHSNINMTDMEMQNMDSEQVDKTESNNKDDNTNNNKSDSDQNSDTIGHDDNVSQHSEQGHGTSGRGEEGASNSNTNRILPVSFFFGFIALIIIIAAITRSKQAKTKKGVS